MSKPKISTRRQADARHGATRGRHHHPDAAPALGRADFQSVSLDENAAFAFLGDYVEGLAARARAREMVAEERFSATLTIGAQQLQLKAVSS